MNKDVLYESRNLLGYENLIKTKGLVANTLEKPVRWEGRVITRFEFLALMLDRNAETEEGVDEKGKPIYMIDKEGYVITKTERDFYEYIKKNFKSSREIEFKLALNYVTDSLKEKVSKLQEKIEKERLQEERKVRQAEKHAEYVERMEKAYAEHKSKITKQEEDLVVSLLQGYLQDERLKHRLYNLPHPITSNRPTEGNYEELEDIYLTVYTLFKYDQIDTFYRWVDMELRHGSEVSLPQQLFYKAIKQLASVNIKDDHIKTIRAKVKAFVEGREYVPSKEKPIFNREDFLAVAAGKGTGYMTMKGQLREVAGFKMNFHLNNKNEYVAYDYITGLIMIKDKKITLLTERLENLIKEGKLKRALEKAINTVGVLPVTEGDIDVPYKYNGVDTTLKATQYEGYTIPLYYVNTGVFHLVIFGGTKHAFLIKESKEELDSELAKFIGNYPTEQDALAKVVEYYGEK